MRTDFVKASWLNQTSQATSLAVRIQEKAITSMLNPGQEHCFSTKTWTVDDFSRIYVQYKPHLERHVWKLLRNSSQTEDVVQESFLYLITSLPNLDSEVGVLRFLKWKSRLLALDLLRLNSGGQLSIEEVNPEQLADSSMEPARSLELAEEAAIVQLALAKISPRQREALIATVLEERSNEDVAARMGLSQNALRQLTHRARRAFKLSLNDEVEARGLSLSQVLGSSIRKALEETKSVAKLGGAAILLSGLMVFGGVQWMEDGGSFLAESEDPARLLSQNEKNEKGSVLEVTDSFNGEAGSPERGRQQASLDEEPAAPEALRSAAEPIGNSEGRFSVDRRTETTDQAWESQPSSGQSLPSNQDWATTALTEEFSRAFNNNLASKLGESSASLWELLDSGSAIQLHNSSGLHVELVYDLDANQPIQFSWITFYSGDVRFIAVPRMSFSELKHLQDGYLVSYVATDLVIGDVEGAMGNLASNETELSRSAMYVEFYLDSEKLIYDAHLNLEPRI